MCKISFDILISNIANLNLSLLGIGLTVLTVLISFAINKKEELKVYNELYKKGRADVLLKGKIKSAIEYLKKIRATILHTFAICCLSGISYIGLWLNVLGVNNHWVGYSMIAITSISVVYAIALIAYLILYFLNYVKIDPT